VLSRPPWKLDFAFFLRAVSLMGSRGCCVGADPAMQGHKRVRSCRFTRLRCAVAT